MTVNSKYTTLVTEAVRIILAALTFSFSSLILMDEESDNTARRPPETPKKVEAAREMK